MPYWGKFRGYASFPKPPKNGILNKEEFLYGKGAEWRIIFGSFHRRSGMGVLMRDKVAAQMLNAKAIASRKTPSEIVVSILRKELTVAHVEV